MNAKQLCVVLLISVVLAGCRGSNQPVTNTNVFTGVDGLEMRFMRNAPPPTVYENSPFEVGVVLDNQGIHDIQNGILSLSLEEDYMELVNGQSTEHFTLRGKDVYNVLGEEKYLSFQVLPKELEKQSQIHTTNVIATACYDYHTWATPEVCIDPDVYNANQGDKNCRMHDLNLGSQGSPVAVTKVEVRVLPEDNKLKPWFKVYVKNKGRGRVIHKDRVDVVCSSQSLDSRDWNTIHVEGFLGKDKLTCKPNPMRLENQRDYVVCYRKEGIKQQETAYTTLLRIKLHYGYTSSISSEVTIESLLKPD